MRPQSYTKDCGDKTEEQSNVSQRFRNEGFPPEDLSREAPYDEPQQRYTKPILRKYSQPRARPN